MNKLAVCDDCFYEHLWAVIWKDYGIVRIKCVYFKTTWMLLWWSLSRLLVGESSRRIRYSWSAVAIWMPDYKRVIVVYLPQLRGELGLTMVSVDGSKSVIIWHMLVWALCILKFVNLSVFRVSWNFFVFLLLISNLLQIEINHYSHWIDFQSYIWNGIQWYDGDIYFVFYTRING